MSNPVFQPFARPVLFAFAEASRTRGDRRMNLLQKKVPLILPDRIEGFSDMPD